MTPTILIVDDDPVVRAVLRVMVERMGALVTDADSVTSASTVLDKAATDGVVFDVVICDYEMPDGNGLDLLDTHRSLAERFVLLTGTKERDDLDDHRVDQVSTYLTKPVGSDDLAAAVMSLIGDSQLA